MVFYISDLPIRRLKFLECEESIYIEMRLKIEREGYLVTIDPHPQGIICLKQIVCDSFIQ